MFTYHNLSIPNIPLMLRSELDKRRHRPQFLFLFSSVQIVMQKYSKIECIYKKNFDNLRQTFDNLRQFLKTFEYY